MINSRIETVEFIDIEYKPNDIGEQIEISKNSQFAYAKIKSVGQKEFFSAKTEHFKAELVLNVFFFDYSGQNAVIINGKRYKVYRTFATGDNVEVYVSKWD